MFERTEEQRIILDTVRRIAQAEIEPRAAELDEKASFPEHALRSFSENGLLNPLLPSSTAASESLFTRLP